MFVFPPPPGVASSIYPSQMDLSFRRWARSGKALADSSLSTTYLSASISIFPIVFCLPTDWPPQPTTSVTSQYRTNCAGNGGGGGSSGGHIEKQRRHAAVPRAPATDWVATLTAEPANVPSATATPGDPGKIKKRSYLFLVFYNHNAIKMVVNLGKKGLYY